MKTIQNITLVMTQDNLLYNKAINHYLNEFCNKTFSADYQFNIRSFFSAETGANQINDDVDIVIVDHEIKNVTSGNPGFRLLKKAVTSSHQPQILFISPRESFSTALIKIKDAIRKKVYKMNAKKRAK